RLPLSKASNNARSNDRRRKCRPPQYARARHAQEDRAVVARCDAGPGQLSAKQPHDDAGLRSALRRVDVVHLAGFDQGMDGRGTMAASVRTGEDPVSKGGVRPTRARVRTYGRISAIFRIAN